LSLVYTGSDYFLAVALRPHSRLPPFPAEFPVSLFTCALLGTEPGKCGHAAENNVDDVGFIALLLDRLETWLDLDTRRIYATGAVWVILRPTCSIFVPPSCASPQVSTRRCLCPPLPAPSCRPVQRCHALLQACVGPQSFPPHFRNMPGCRCSPLRRHLCGRLDMRRP